jgi:hypothetical protein
MNRLLGYLVTLGLLLLVFEGLLRLAGCSPPAQVVEFHATRGWANKKDVTVHRSMKEFSVDYELNSHGMRGPEIPVAKPAGKTRLLFVGDSFTLGYTVDDEQGFVRVLERDLRANGHDVEALNGGTEGYATDQEVVFFEEDGKRFAPDYVVFAPYLNDVFWTTQDKYTIRGKPRFAVTGDQVALASAPLVDPGPTPWWVRSTQIGTIIDALRNPRRVPMAPVKASTVSLEDAPMIATSLPEIDEAWKVTTALVARLGKAIRDTGAKPIALLVPNKWEIHPDAPLPRTLGSLTLADLAPEKPTDRFKAICEAAGFAVVDPRPALKAEAAKGNELYFDIDFHWNADGNQVVAGALLERLSQPDMLGPGTGKILHETLVHTEKKGIPKWAFVVGAIWLVLGSFYAYTYRRENKALAFLKVGLLIGFVTSVFLGVGAVAASLPPAVGRFVFPAILIALLLFIVIKIGRRFGVISELYGTFLRRGHWYMLPMLVVMLSIGMLLVVAASSPFVAPFIYTLF